MNLTLFDLDGTLLPFDSNHAFGSYLVELGWSDAATWRRRNAEFHRLHDLGELDVHTYIDFATQFWRDRPRADAEQARVNFMREHLVPAIPPRSLALTARHRADGDLMALVTGTNDFLAEPIAQALGIDHLIAVRLERDADGRFTGRIAGVPSFGAGKVHRVDEWLSTLGYGLADFERVTFYGDSVNDVPMMERSTHPVAVNPSPPLRAIAERRGWPVMDGWL